MSSTQQKFDEIYNFNGGITYEEKMFGDSIRIALNVQPLYCFKRHDMNCSVYRNTESIYVCQIRTAMSAKMGDYYTLSAPTPYKLVRLIAAFRETPSGAELSIRNLKQCQINKLANAF